MRAHRLMTVALLAALAVTPAFGESVIVNNSTISVDENFGELNSWQVGGVEQVFRAAWLYSVSSGGSEVVYPTNMAPAGNVISATFHDATNLLDVNLTYTLNGGAVGTRASQLIQTAVFKNGNSSPLSLHVFAYTDWSVGGADLNNVSISGSTATQTGPDGWKVTETVSGLPNVRTVGDASDTVLSAAHNIVSKTPPNLIESLGPFSTDTDVDYAFQWNLTLVLGIR